jgi:hypothetical protein
MKRLKFLLPTLIFLSLIGLSSVTAQQEDVDFRFLNLLEDSVDVYRNESVSFFGIQAGAISAERTISPGDHTFAIYAENSDPAQSDPLATFTFTAEADTEALIIALEQGGQSTLTNHIFDASPLLVNRTRIELLNLSDAAPSVTITAQNNDTLFENVSSGEASSADAPSGNYQLSLTDSAGEVVSSNSLNASPGELETVILYGANRVQTYSLTRQLDQLGLLRFVHAGRVAPPVDVYLNGELAFFTISFTGWADYVALEPGNYTIDIYEAGTDTLLLSDALQLGITGPITAVLMGEHNPRLTFNQDNHQYIGANLSRVRFINAALDLLALEVTAEGEGSLIAALGYVLASRNRDIESGTRVMAFGETGGASFVTMPNFEFEPNHAYTFVALGNGLIDGSIQVLTMDWNWRQGSAPVSQ